jgi:hypothetical protein
VEVGFYGSHGWADYVALSGGYAYVADGEGGLRVIDVSTPSAPVGVGFSDTPGYAIGVTVSGGYVYVADYDAGMEVFRDCPPAFVVSVDVRGSGSGTVSSSPAGIDCGATCQADFDEGTAVTLSMDPDPGSSFDGWVSGGCTGTGDCAVTMTQDTSVIALCNAAGACGLGDTMSLEQMSIGWSQEFEACTSITAGNDFEVATAGEVVFRAGQSVALGSGFSVAAGAVFTVEIDPEVGSPP